MKKLLFFLTGVLAAALMAFAVESSAVELPDHDYMRHEMSAKDAAEYLKTAVVRVGDDYCSGAKIGPKMFLTAGHCMSGRHFRGLNAKIMYGFETVWAKSILYPISNKDNGKDKDWAIVYTFEDLPKVASLKIACGEKPYLGQKIAYLGYPYPTKYAFGLGYISSLEGTTGSGGNNADILVDMPASGGSSGSVVISMDTGHVVGVLTEVVYGDRSNIFLTGLESIQNLDQCEAVSKPEDEGKTSTPPGAY